jgi:hypothetical protein
MELKDVGEVIAATTMASANDLLNKGWVLLAVVAGSGGPDYVLGRARGSDPLPGKKDPLAGLTAGDLARANRDL